MKRIIILAVLSFLCYQSIAQLGPDEVIGDPNRAVRLGGYGKVTKMQNRESGRIVFWDENSGEFVSTAENFFDTGYTDPTDTTYFKICNSTTDYCIRIKKGTLQQVASGDTNFIRLQFPNITRRQPGGGSTDSFNLRRLFFAQTFSNTSGIMFDMQSASALQMRGRGGLVNKANLVWDFGHSAGGQAGQTAIVSAFRNTDSVLSWRISGEEALFHGFFARDSSIGYTTTNFPKISGTSIFNQADVFWHPYVMESSTGGLPASPAVRAYRHAKGKFSNITRVTTTTYTTTANDEIIYADAASNNVTITLMGLGAGGVNNLNYTIKRIDSSNNTVIINPPNVNWRIDRYRQLKLDTSSSVVLVGRNFGSEYLGGSTAYGYKIVSWYKSSQNNGIVYNSGEGEKIAGFSIWFICLPLFLGIGIGIGQKINNKNASV